PCSCRPTALSSSTRTTASAAATVCRRVRTGRATSIRPRTRPTNARCAITASPRAADRMRRGLSHTGALSRRPEEPQGSDSRIPAHARRARTETADGDASEDVLQQPRRVGTLGGRVSGVDGFIYPNEMELQWSLLIVIYPFITGLVAGAFILASLERVF